DGVGMSPEQIAGVFEKNEGRQGSRIGIVNVYERIKHYYGDKYGVSIESQSGLGTKIIVRIPLIKSEGDNHEA
ncbi:MAG TPA: sensor histidine kinase, partial [Patescibacteria group bacterium]|nr:sensor histidine kinase [Patescibacteria group bacterium]